MRDPWNDSELARRFAASARDSAARAPLNAALATVIARRPNLSGLLAHAPDTQQLPVLLLAAIHALVLDETDHPLARWYPNLTDDARDPADADLAPTLEAFVEERAATVLEIVGSRHVQTNEVGRCALLVPAFALLATPGTPLAHVDVGCSAGLTTLWPRFSYRYDDGPTIGDAGAPVRLACGTEGTAPLDLASTELPRCVAAIGIDAHPIDVGDADDARWLEACCWPDQADRFHRLRAAITMARADPPRLVRGDAVDEVGPALDALPADAHPVVTTTWALNYLEPDRRRAFLDELGRIGRERDLSYVHAEAPALTPELDHPVDDADEHLTALGLVTWRDGERSARHLGSTHPHGYWIRWA